MRPSARKWLRRLGAGWVGAGLTIAASFWAGYNFNHWVGTDTRAVATVTDVTKPSLKRATIQTNHSDHSTGGDPLNVRTIYVRRDGSVLRDKPEWSGRTLAHKDRGAAVALLGSPQDGWAKVRTDGTVGWMRASILGDNPSSESAAR